MRILGFSKKWDKLYQKEFTTFRCLRRDKDWEVGEQVQIVYKPRSKDKELMGIAEIIDRCEKHIATYGFRMGVTNEEAQADGFENRDDMLRWMVKTYGGLPSLMNKLLLAWVDKNGTN